MKDKLKYFISFSAGIINGLLGSGGGTVLMPMLYNYLDDERSAHNSISFYVLPLSVISASVYRRDIDYKVVLLLCAGAFFGGLAGLKISKKCSADFLKILFALIIIFSGIISFL